MPFVCEKRIQWAGMGCASQMYAKKRIHCAGIEVSKQDVCEKPNTMGRFGGGRADVCEKANIMCTTAMMNGPNAFTARNYCRGILQEEVQQ